MSVQNVAGALMSPKGVTKNSYEPYLVPQVVLLQFEFGNTPNVTYPKLFDALNYESKDEGSGRRSWGMLPSSQHFEGRRVCWSSMIGTRMNDKQVNYSHELAQTKQQVD